MDAVLAQRLMKLTESFYQTEASSFSETRTRGWEGWGRLFRLLAAEGPDKLVVSDVAAGNGRFGRALADALPDVRIRYQVIDSCAPLMDEAKAWPHSVDAVRFERDLIAPLLERRPALPSELEPADLVCCFGFLHHVPSTEARLQLVQELVDAAVPGGLVVLALWRFAEDPARARKAEATTDAACQELGIPRDALGPGDYLLGWQGRPGVWRYCHSFTEEESEAIADSVSDQASVEATYLADGKTHDQNRYLVLRKRL